MEIVKIPVEKLLPAKCNPRKDLQPGDPEFEKLKRSVEEFGYVEPIIWNRRTGVVVGGHQRLKVLQHLGYTEVDCVVLDIDEQKEKALNVALNKISGDWDIPLLTSLLKDLNDSGYDATLTGFDVSEMSDLFDDQSEIVEDDPPEVAAETQEPFTKPGDRWILGGHVLYCGDSTSKKDVAALMGGETADLCVTDPPYNVAYEGSNGLTIQNDNMPEEMFLKFLKDAFGCMHDVMKPGAPFYIWHAETEGGAFRTATNAALSKVRQMLIWNKNAFTMGHQDYQWKHEACMYYTENSHPAIISAEMFEMAKKEMARRAGAKDATTGTSRYTSKYPFSGLLVCGTCGSVLRRHTRTVGSGKYVPAWGCATRIKEGRPVCDSHHVREDVLERTYTEAVRQITESADEVTAAVSEGAMLTMEPENRERLVAVEQAIIETQEQALALHKKKVALQITDAEYTDAIQTCSQRMKELEAEQAELQTIATRYSEVKAWLDTFEESIRNGDIMDANDALVMKALVDEIIVHDTGIEIHCKCGITIEQEYVQ